MFIDYIYTPNIKYIKVNVFNMTIPPDYSDLSPIICTTWDLKESLLL